MPDDRTLEQIRRDGLLVLREKLGVAGMVRFLQQFEHGSGNYAAERRAWVEGASLPDIREMLEKSADRKSPRPRRTA